MTHPADFYTGLVVEAYSALKGRNFDPTRYAAFVRAHGEPGLAVRDVVPPGSDGQPGDEFTVVLTHARASGGSGSG